jgi:predicted phosphodiesterase
MGIPKLRLPLTLKGRMKRWKMSVEISRKSFLAGMSATAWSMLHGKAAQAGESRLRLAIMSDVHIFRPGDWAEKRFKLALDWCRSCDVDGVLVAGDLTEEGYEEQLSMFAEMYFKAFPGDMGRDGRHVERLFVTGNHDIGEFWRNRFKVKDEATIAACRERSLMHHKDRIWRKCFNEPWEPIFRRTVKGIDFVGAHWGCWNEKALAEFFAKNPVDPKKPFVYAQHSHPRGTVYSPGTGDCDNGSSTRFFATKPNAIVFSGHSHLPVRDARAIWQGGFTSIATGAISQMFVRSGCENSTFRCGHEGVPHMGMFSGSDGATVLLADFYGDRLVIRRQNVIYGERIADDWVIPLPKTDDVWGFAARSKRAAAPEFPEGAEVKVGCRDGKNRKGEAERQVVVAFPRAIAAGADSLVEKYRLRILENGVEKLERSVYAQKYFLAEKRVSAGVKEEFCVFAAAEIPDGATVSVQQLNEWGQAGRSIDTKMDKC